MGKREDEMIDKMCANWIINMPGIGRETKMKILKTAGTPLEAYEYTEKIIKELTGNDKYADWWKEYKKRQEPKALWDTQIDKGIHFVYYGEKDYPKRLLEISDPPIGLYYIGGLPQKDAHIVSIIGARQNSEYGRCMAEHFADSFAKEGITVVSGMAMGIDGIAQRAAIKAGGRSYGVLGSGVDVIYPESNKKLYYQLIENGGVISESVPGTAPHAGLFPQRNRIISGLSDVVLVVEAREKSGTLITVDMALEQSREVYVIPGRCTDPLSKGCNKLIRQGAGVAVTPDDIIQDMKWRITNELEINENQKENISQTKSTNLTISISDIAREIAGVMDVTPCTQDEIIQRLRAHGCSISVPYILQGLLELEMLELVVRMAGQYKLNSTKFK